MKRFYREATVDPRADGFVVLLDGRPLRTPAGRILTLPSRALARRVAEEWAGQTDEVRPQTMPLTRLVSTTLDLMPERRGDAETEVMATAAYDVLCYRAHHPQELVTRQIEAWQPWLDWAEREFGARLVPTTGVVPIEQPEAALDALRRALAATDDWHLVAIHAAAKLTGSAVLALALAGGALSAAQAFEIAVVDESYMMETWGEEPEQQRRRAGIRAELGAVEAFVRSLGTA